jgi:hypothetical protein
MSYVVLRDTREQQGWDFPLSANCTGVQDATLETGDYTLAGYEKVLCIERKGSCGEFARNLLENRFEKELQRMEAFPHSFIILEFTMAEILSFPKGSGIPPYLWKSLKTSPYFLLKRFIELQFKYKTKIILAGKHGKDVASSVFKRMVEHVAQKETGETNEGSGTHPEVSESRVSRVKSRTRKPRVSQYIKSADGRRRRKSA